MRYGIMLAIIVSMGLLNWTPAWTESTGDGANPEVREGGPERRGGERRHDGPRRKRHGRAPHGGLLSIIDRDKDGTLSAAEIADASESLKPLDANDDGQITREELRSHFRSQSGTHGRGGSGGADGNRRRSGGPGNRSGKNIADHIMGHDADGNGKVEASEMTERMSRLLDRVDKNNDGAIDRAEAEAIGEHKRHRDRRDRQQRPEESQE